MWIELGNNFLVNLDCFSQFNIRHWEEGENYIYGTTEHGTIIIYQSEDKKETRLQFEKLRALLLERSGKREGFINNIFDIPVIVTEAGR